MKTIVACLIVLSLGSNFPIAISEGPAVAATGPTIDLHVHAGNFFSRNNGQIPCPDVIFHSSNAYFTPTGVIFRVVERKAMDRPTFPPGLPVDFPAVDAPLKMHIFRTTFAGANPVIPFGREELPNHSNFFIGNDSSKWVTDVPNYQEIVYEGLYDGIDLVYRAVPDGLKYEFIVHPGGDAADINIRYEGAGVRTDGASIFIDTTAGLVVDGGLEAYQPFGGCNDLVAARIIVDGDTVSFDVEYDISRDLVIDPMIYSTFLGGGATDLGNGLTVDGSDNPIITGYTWSTDFPTTPGAYQTATKNGYDLFVTKLNASGDRLLYSTYVGGSSSDEAYSINIDSDNNTVIAGYTFSNDFPTTAGAYDRTYANGCDVVVFKLNTIGNVLIFSTYLGGQGREAASGIALDPGDNIYLTGGTDSSDFPVTAGAYDTFNPSGTESAFIVKLSPGGDTLLFSTYFGQGSYDYGISIGHDSSGAVFVTGITNGGIDTKDAFDPYYNGGAYDIFAIKLSPDGTTLDYSTYLGGNDYEFPARIEVNSSGNARIVGYTSSADFPTTSGAFSQTLQGGFDCFMLELKPTGSELVFSTLIGGSQDEWINSVRTNSAGDMIATGVTYSNDFPMTPASEDTKLMDSYDCFLLKMKSDGTQLAYSNYIGYGSANWLELDGAGNPIVTGMTDSADFPTTKGAYDQQFNGASDVFIFSYRLPTPPLEPRNLTAGLGDRQALLNWTAPMHDGYRPVLSYTIYRGANSTALSKIATVGNTTVFTDTGLVNGWKYYYAVSATNGVGEGNRSAVVNVTPGAAPSKPGRLQAIPGDRFVNLSWSRPDDIKGYPITGYSIFRGRGSSSLSPLSELGNLTHFNDTSVSNGATYCYAVSAINDMGEGPVSDTINATPGKPPSPPTNLTAETGNGRVLLQWDAPVDDGGFDIESFKIYQIEMDLVSLVSEVQEPSYTLESLENGRTYYYAVSAVNVRGEGEKCEELSVVPGAPPAAPSLMAQGLNGQVSLAWSISDDGGIPVTLFRIYRADGPDSELHLYGETSKTTYDDLLVLNGNAYYYSVSAVNLKGEGNRSAVAGATPTGEGRLPGPPINATATAGDGYILISWIPPPDTGGLKELGYRLYRCESGGSLRFLTDGDGLAFNDTRVFNGVTYYYSISSVNLIGEGQRSAAISATPSGKGRAPGAPLNLSLMRDNDTILLNWTEPADYGGLKIGAYQIYRGTDRSNLILAANTTGPFYSDPSWEFGIRYYYAVSAVNAKGPGPRSEIGEIAVYDVPGEVRNVTAKSGSGYVLLSWEAPMQDGGYEINEFQIYRAQGKGDPSFYISTPVLRLNDSLAVNGLNYSYRIAAVNDLGPGRFSEPINATPGAPPGKPWNLTARMENGKVRLRWDPPSDNGGFKILEYRIFRGSSEKDQEFLASTKEPTFLDDNVKEGGKYYYTVHAVNERGESPASEMKSITAPQTAGTQNGLVIAIISAVTIIAVVAISLVLIIRKRSSISKKKDNDDRNGP